MFSGFTVRVQTRENFVVAPDLHEKMKVPVFVDEREWVAEFFPHSTLGQKRRPRYAYPKGDESGYYQKQKRFAFGGGCNHRTNKQSDGG